MKILTYLLILGMSLGAVATAQDAFRRTTEDMYRESYAAQQLRRSGPSPAEIRAENYRHLYEQCDEHHICTNLGEQAKPEQKKKSELPELVWSVFYSPLA